MFGKEYLETKEVQQAVESVEAALSEFSDSVQSKAKDELLRAMDAQRQHGGRYYKGRGLQISSRIMGGGYA